MAAAISDYIPKTKYHGKLKKETLGQEISLELVLNEDILAGIDKTGLKVIGFKAEMDETSAQQSANKMLIKKGLHAVCLNILKEENHFGSANNTVEFITAETSFTLPLSSKFEIAQKIVELSKSL
jgi:phosphopantothenoylcysteine decarboxylase/phosphopantothenate--cysteine ligase